MVPGEPGEHHCASCVTKALRKRRGSEQRGDGVSDCADVLGVHEDSGDAVLNSVDYPAGPSRHDGFGACARLETNDPETLSAPIQGRLAAEQNKHIG